MKTIKGPAVFLAQFMGDEAPFNSLDGICKYMADLGYKGVQIPTWDSRLIDLEKAATSKTYADELKGRVAEHGLTITELAEDLIRYRSHEAVSVCQYGWRDQFQRWKTRHQIGLTAALAGVTGAMLFWMCGGLQALAGINS